MNLDLVGRMKALAQQLNHHDAPAFHDPAKAWRNRPCLLVAPPTLDAGNGVMDGAPGVEWRILALSKRLNGNLDALTEIAPLLQRVDDVLGAERVEPTPGYRLTPNDNPVAAYLCTYFEIED